MTDDSDLSENARPTTNSDRRNAMARRLRNWTSRRFPTIVESADAKSSRAYYRKKDVADVPASMLPPDQHVALKRVLAAEYYTPAHAERLFSAFERLGWKSAETSAFNRNSADWVARSRRGSNGGSWINLGTVTRPGNNQSFRDAAETELPDGFEHAHAELFSISPSLSCIVVSFDTMVDADGKYEEIARSALGTKLVRTRRGLSITSPRSHKRQVIGEHRERLRRNLLNWFSNNLPGAFSASGKVELFPTCELLFVDGIRAGDDSSPRSLWREYLGLDQHWGVWNSADFAGLTFANPVSHVESQKGHSALVIERSDLLAIDNQTYGGSSDEAYLNRLSMDLPGFVCHWGITPLLRLYQEELSEVRDSTTFSGRSGKAASVLQRLRRVTSNSIDVSLLANELPNAFQHTFWNDQDFSLHEEGQQPISLSDAVTRRSLELVGQLAASDRTIRELLLQQGNLVNALEAIRTQRTMSWLTLVMTVLTIAILVLTAVMAAPVLFPQTTGQPSSEIRAPGP
jgi:hypothetical protein